MEKLIRHIVEQIKGKVEETPEIAIILGSGLSGIADNIENKQIIEYNEIDGMLKTDVEGHKNQFVFVPTTDTWRCLALCLNKEEEPIIVSPIYCVFSINQKKIIPEYLHLFCRRKEIDRYARFHSWGSARENFNFPDMQRLSIPLPPLDVQRAIVNIYKCANEAKQIAAEADRLSREVCPALLQHIIHS